MKHFATSMAPEKMSETSGAQGSMTNGSIVKSQQQSSVGKKPEVQEKKNFWNIFQGIDVQEQMLLWKAIGITGSFFTFWSPYL